ncbi:MAG TPA: class I SAM-dependent methyltransferase, partial [Cyclobacteriaceae bacterium]|nr:class I SAM-dependent methyltransferase [Cyclobacteriaceae bacterium]
MRYGTNNRDKIAILKDKVKTVLFWISRRKYAQREKLRQAKTIGEKHALCNKLLGVHQSRFEITNLLDLIDKKKIKPEVLCEIGTANGGTNLFLASSIPSVNTVLGIDLYVKNKNRIRFFLKDKETHFFDGSSYSPATINQVESELKGKKIDILFIDGDHRYLGVKNDFEMYRPLVRKGGLICFHDIVPDYLTRYNQFTGMWSGDVPKYWSEIKPSFPHDEITEREDQDGQGIGI